MLKLIDYPMNPEGKGVEGFPFPLLTPNGGCLHNITISKPEGDHVRRDIRLTSRATLMRDHLLSLPGLEEIALYENWEGLGRNMFIGCSAALTWDELWEATKPYFIEVSNAEPKEDTLEQMIIDARQRLDSPVLLAERFPHASHCFIVHARKPLTKRVIFQFGEDDTSSEPLQALFEFIADDLGQAKIWVEPYSISVHLAKGTKGKQVETAIRRVASLVGSALYPNQKMTIRERDAVPCTDDDPYDLD